MCFWLAVLALAGADLACDLRRGFGIGADHRVDLAVDVGGRWPCPLGLMASDHDGVIAAHRHGR